MNELKSSWSDDFRALKGALRRKPRESEAERPRKLTIALVASCAFVLGVLVAYLLFSRGDSPIAVVTPEPTEAPSVEISAEPESVPELLEVFRESVPGTWEDSDIESCSLALSSPRDDVNSLVLRRTVGEAFSASGYDEHLSWDGESRIEGFTISGEREDPVSEAVFKLAGDSMTLCVR